MSTHALASAPSRSAAAARRRGAPRWLLALGFVSAAAALGAQGCGESESADPTVTCDARAVQVVGPDGSCTWASSCESEGMARCGEDTVYACDALPTDACTFDSRCQLERAVACPDCPSDGDPTNCACTSASYCEPIPSDGCAALDEASCVAASDCHAQYGWTGGGATDGGSGDSDDSAGAAPADPCPPEICTPTEPAPPPPETQWGYLGCVDNTNSGPCVGLDPMACETHPGCEPIWGGGDCACEPGTDCECPAIAVYEGCRQVTTGCEAYADPATCDATDGCHWDLAGKTEPCVCPDDGTPCSCDGFAPIPADGSCVADFPEERCYDIADQTTCTDVGCEWLPYGVEPDERPAPDCAPDNPDCGGSGFVAPPDGFCAPPGSLPPPTPTGCADYTDAFSCASSPGCVWSDVTASCVQEIIDPPPPTGCADYTDAATCSATEGCAWNDGSSGEVPCDCDPMDPNCTCAGLIAPACDPDSALGADGTCYDSAGNPAEAYCCDQTDPPPPAGWCESVTPAP